MKLCYLVLCLGVGGQAFAYRRAAVAPRVARAPVVDGSLLEWNPGLYGQAPAIPLQASIGVVEEGKISGPEDFAAELFAVVAGRSLYIAGIVTDDHLQFERGGEMWRGDMVELMLEIEAGGYLHVGVNPAGEAFVFHPLAKGGEAPPRVRAAARIQEPGYTFELEVPFAAFGATGRETQLRFNLAARDADPSERPAAHLTWSGYRHNLRASFGTLTLEAAAPAAAAAWPACPAPATRVDVSAPLSARGRTLLAGKSPVKLRMVNYQSARESWPAFWTRWDLARVQQDLSLASRLRLNAIRLFVFFREFGGGAPTEEMISRLEAVVDEAAKRGLLSVVSFFPFDKDFRPERYPEMESHLKAIVSRFKGDPAIAMWDLMNEPDHMWIKPEHKVSAAQVAAWSRKMAAAVRAADPSHLLTIGLAGHFAVATGEVKEDEALPLVDVLSIHWYFDPLQLDRGLARARASMEKPLVLQEFGATGLLLDEAAAAAHYRRVCQAAEKADLAGVAAWELFDHPVGSVAHFDRPWREAEDSYFGLLTADGVPKAQAGVFCRCLDAPALKVVRQEGRGR